MSAQLVRDLRTHRKNLSPYTHREAIALMEAAADRLEESADRSGDPQPERSIEDAIGCALITYAEAFARGERPDWRDYAAVVRVMRDAPTRGARERLARVLEQERERALAFGGPVSCLLGESALEILVGALRTEPARERALEAALWWCGGSADFAPGGKAHEGWVRTVLPLLTGEAVTPTGEEVANG